MKKKVGVDISHFSIFSYCACAIASDVIKAVFTLQANWRSEAKRGEATPSEAKRSSKAETSKHKRICIGIKWLRSRENSI